MGSCILIIGGDKFVTDLEPLFSQQSVEIMTASDESGIAERLREGALDAVIFDDDEFRARDAGAYRAIIDALQRSKKRFIIVSSRKMSHAVIEARDSGAADFIVRPYNYREFIARVNAVRFNKARISCIGGGTGLFNLLLGLKTLPRALLTSIVSTTDDGGSSGRLRASFGVLPPGDIRRCLVALSNAPELMNALMKFRFDKGEPFDGHNFGNLMLTVLAQIKGSMSEAVRALGDILNIQGIVLPVTSEQTTLCALFEDDTLVKGESKIDLGQGRDPCLHVKELWHEPMALCDINAYSAIINSDIVTMGPGDLFTSVITNLVVRDIREGISRTHAKKVYICNLMTKPGETAHYDALDHVREVVKYMGGDHLDYAIISNTKVSDKAVLEYSKKDQRPVEAKNVDKIRDFTKAEVILADVGHETELVRHDSIKIRDEILRIIERVREKGGV